MKRPYANDWKNISIDVQYSSSLNLWYDQEKHKAYDERSAIHNGIIGPGHCLRNMLKDLSCQPIFP